MHLVRDPLPEADRRARLSPVRIVGVGSPFGADRVGWAVAGALARDPWLPGLAPGQVSVSCADRPGLRLLELLEAPGLVVLIDAMRAGGRAGAYACFDGLRLPADAGFTSTHDFGIKAALDLAGALGGIAPDIRVYGIEIADGDTRSTPAPGRILPTAPPAMIFDESIIKDIRELVDNYLKEHKEPTDDRNP
jgi:hydrogenase maturation protease